MKFRTKIRLIFFVFISLNSIDRLIAQEFNIKDFGAISDGITLNTYAIQKAIDYTAAKGGGKVIVPKGIFLTGTVNLKNNIELHLQEGAILLGSSNWNDYQRAQRWYALILCNSQNKVKITGKGTIDGNCIALVNDIMQKIADGVIKKPIHRNRADESVRPQIIEFTRCKNVEIKDITLKDAACWVQTYLNCTDMVFDNVIVRSFKYWNNDGLDISDCKNVVIKNCDINSADDGICLKSYDANSRCENIRISNCIIRSGSSAFKCGTPSFGGFKDIYVDSLYVYDTDRSVIALQVVDGGIMQNVQITNIKSKNTTGSIFIRLGKRNAKGSPGIINGISIKNIDLEVKSHEGNNPYKIELHKPPASEAGPPKNSLPATLVGLPNFPFKNVTIENANIHFIGGGRQSVAQIYTDPIGLSLVPEKEKEYPEIAMFGELPASGFYVRHAKSLSLKNIQILLEKPDYRYLLLFDDVKNISLDNIFLKNTTSKPVILFNRVSGQLVKDVRATDNNGKLILQNPQLQ